jgi:phosphopantothenoylcysteine decarboxylase/phosphopantothenate--cysteine ligase
VEKGELASGLVGDGRMAEPDQIVEFVDSRFFLTGSLVGKKALVTAGPTYEAIDPVRFIGNHSSGRMGIAIARELYARGAEVTLVLGPVPGGGFSANGIRLINVVSAQQMYEASQSVFEGADLAVMAAAVADYTPAVKATEKIKKKEDSFNIELTKTKDILKSLGQQKKKGQVLVGFALETNDEQANAKKKLQEKNADMIVLNSLRDEGAGFGHDTNRITIFHKDGREQPFELKTKQDVAKDIVDTIINTYYV